jgi:hypothetical protein
MILASHLDRNTVGVHTLLENQFRSFYRDGTFEPDLPFHFAGHSRDGVRYFFVQNTMGLIRFDTGDRWNALWWPEYFVQVTRFEALGNYTPQLLGLYRAWLILRSYAPRIQNTGVSRAEVFLPFYDQRPFYLSADGETPVLFGPVPRRADHLNPQAATFVPDSNVTVPAKQLADGEAVKTNGENANGGETRVAEASDSDDPSSTTMGTVGGDSQSASPAPTMSPALKSNQDLVMAAVQTEAEGEPRVDGDSEDEQDVSPQPREQLK